MNSKERKKLIRKELHHSLHNGIFMFGCRGMGVIFCMSVFVHIVSFLRKYYQEKSSDLNIANIVLTDNRFPLVYVMI